MQHELIRETQIPADDGQAHLIDEGHAMSIDPNGAS